MKQVLGCSAALSSLGTLGTSGTLDSAIQIGQRQGSRTPLARDHGGAEQELSRTHRIGSEGAQLVEVALPGVVIPRFEPLLVGNRLLLHELARDRAAPQIIHVEESLGTTAQHDLGEHLGQASRVLQATVETHPTDRIVHVRRIAGQQHTPGAKCCCDALVCRVEIPVHHLVRLAARKELLEPRFDGLVTQQLLLARTWIGRIYGTPQPRRAAPRYLETIAPLFRISQVVAIAKSSRALEVERRRQHEETLFPGEALEGNPALLADAAAAAVGAHEKSASVMLHAAGAAHRDDDRAVVLRYLLDPLVEQHLDIRQGPQPVENQTCRLVLLALDDVRIRGVAREQRVIELSDTLAGRSIPEPDGRRDQPDTDHVVDEAGGAEDLECARMRRRGAWVVQ